MEKAYIKRLGISMYSFKFLVGMKRKIRNIMWGIGDGAMDFVLISLHFVEIQYLGIAPKLNSQ